MSSLLSRAAEKTCIKSIFMIFNLYFPWFRLWESCFWFQNCLNMFESIIKLFPVCWGRLPPKFTRKLDFSLQIIPIVLEGLEKRQNQIQRGCSLEEVNGEKDFFNQIYDFMILRHPRTFMVVQNKKSYLATIMSIKLSFQSYHYKHLVT